MQQLCLNDYLAPDQRVMELTEDRRRGANARKELLKMKSQNLAFSHLYGAKLILMRLGVRMKQEKRSKP